MVCQVDAQKYELPKIIPPSTTAQNFMRYGEIPVDYSTGVPKINIPIYTIQGKKISLPISISYHASGIKVHDVASEVGLGWILNAGGIVSRTILTSNDEQDHYSDKKYSNAEDFLSWVGNTVNNSYNPSCVNYPGVHVVEMLLNANPGDDLISDRYFYQLPNGSSGVFRYEYKKNGISESSPPIMLPYRPYKIEKNVLRTSYGNDVTEYRITDDEGVLYKFQRFQEPNNGSTEWFITDMISADGTETIKFNYSPQRVISRGTPTSSLLLPKNFIMGAGNNDCDPSQFEPYPISRGMVTDHRSYSVALSSIESNDLIVSISYSDREDFQYLKKISEIKIATKRKPENIEKKFVFNHSYFGNLVNTPEHEKTDKRLKLDSINVLGRDMSSQESFSFYYESQNLPPYSSQSIDFWGYYNGANNGSLVPKNFLPKKYQNTGDGGDRMADDGSLAKACMLREIKYPLGGKTKFEFERAYVNGVVSTPNGDGYFGGFRVSKITNYSSKNEVSNIKTYKYEFPHYNIIGGDFYTYLQKYIDHSDPLRDFVYCSEFGGCWHKYSREIVSSTPIIPHDLSPGLPIAYSSVYEYDGTISENKGYTLYSYNMPSLISYTGDLREQHAFQEDRGNYEPKLTYKLIKNNEESKIAEEWNYYSNHFEQEFNTGINITRTLTNFAHDKQIDLANDGCHGCVMDYVQSIKANDTKAYSNANLLDYNIKRTYDQIDKSRYIDQRVDYSYNQHNLMVKDMTIVNTLGDNILTEYKYPYDFATLSPYNMMLMKNILTPVIEETITNTSKGKQIEKLRTVYDTWNGNIIEPKLIKAQTDVFFPLEDKVTFMSYDEKSNITSLKKNDDIPITYIWGYDKNLPIAKVDNSNLVSQLGSENQDKFISTSLYIPMGNTSYELGSFTITEEKNYKIDRNYENIPSIYSIMYQIRFENLNNNADSVSFTDITPSGGHTHTFTSQSQLLKPGTYKVHLSNIGYNGYQGFVEHIFNFTIYNTVKIDKSIPFHTSFEEDVEHVSTTHAKTGNKSHIGQYNLKIPPASLGYEKVIVSYWGKSHNSESWEYVEAIVDANGQNHNIGGSYYYIDEVRMYPINAMMTTYTYDPFYKHPTSILMPNNQGEYYKYGNFGRLIEVRNEKGELLKEYKYHYKQ